jgi:hypothetical protein
MSEVVRLVQPSGRLRRVLSHDEVMDLSSAKICAECALEELEAGNHDSCLDILRFAARKLRELCPPGRMG